MNDESPTVVKWPQGNHQILAEAEDYGHVTVPVIITWENSPK